MGPGEEIGPNSNPEGESSPDFSKVVSPLLYPSAPTAKNLLTGITAPWDDEFASKLWQCAEECKVSPRYAHECFRGLSLHITELNHTALINAMRGFLYLATYAEHLYTPAIEALDALIQEMEYHDDFIVPTERQKLDTLRFAIPVFGYEDHQLFVEGTIGQAFAVKIARANPSEETDSKVVLVQMQSLTDHPDIDEAICYAESGAVFAEDLLHHLSETLNPELFDTVNVPALSVIAELMSGTPALWERTQDWLFRQLDYASPAIAYRLGEVFGHIDHFLRSITIDDDDIVVDGGTTFERRANLFRDRTTEWLKERVTSTLESLDDQRTTTKVAVLCAFAGMCPFLHSPLIDEIADVRRAGNGKLKAIISAIFDGIESNYFMGCALAESGLLRDLVELSYEIRDPELQTRAMEVFYFALDNVDDSIPRLISGFFDLIPGLPREDFAGHMGTLRRMLRYRSDDDNNASPFAVAIVETITRILARGGCSPEAVYEFAKTLRVAALIPDDRVDESQWYHKLDAALGYLSEAVHQGGLSGHRWIQECQTELRKKISHLLSTRSWQDVISELPSGSSAQVSVIQNGTARVTILGCPDSDDITTWAAQLAALVIRGEAKPTILISPEFSLRLLLISIERLNPHGLKAPMTVFGTHSFVGDDTQRSDNPVDVMSRLLPMKPAPKHLLPEPDKPSEISQLLRLKGGADLGIFPLMADGRVGLNGINDIDGTNFMGDRTIRFDPASKSLRSLLVRAGSSVQRKAKPMEAVTLGLDTVRQCKKILLVASDPSAMTQIQGIIDGKLPMDNAGFIFAEHPEVLIVVYEDIYDQLGLD